MRYWTLVIMSVTLLLIYSCKKSDPSYCWQLIDASGNRLQQVCGKTEAQMQADYPNACRYYRTTGTTYCWLVNGSMYFEGLTEEGIQKTVQCFVGGAATVQKVDCGYCQLFYHRIKRKYKPTGVSTFSGIRGEVFCADTVRVLFNGRQQVLKDTPDSLVVRQYSSNGTF